MLINTPVIEVVLRQKVVAVGKMCGEYFDLYLFCFGLISFSAAIRPSTPPSSSALLVIGFGSNNRVVKKKKFLLISNFSLLLFFYLFYMKHKKII